MASVFDFLSEDYREAFHLFNKLMQRTTLPTAQERQLLANFINDCLHNDELKVQLQKAIKHLDPNAKDTQDLILLLDMMHWTRYQRKYEAAQGALNEPTSVTVPEKIASVGLLRDLAKLKPFLAKLERLGILSHQINLEKVFQTVNKSQETLLRIDIQTKLTKPFFMTDHYQLETARGQTLNYFKQLLHVLSHAPLQRPSPK